jgi:C4-dicarboxylate-specific signal transduction histidine kinase
LKRDPGFSSKREPPHGCSEEQAASERAKPKSHNHSAAVLVDKIQIQQVLLNLIRNAFEAMQGSDRRELVISTIPAPDGMMAVTVADTGPGIASDVMAKLFQPFVSTKARGMGVGLSISRTIVESHGGRITCEPDPNGGTKMLKTLASVGGDLSAKNPALAAAYTIVTAAAQCAAAPPTN